jgi:hypothetical protein
MRLTVDLDEQTAAVFQELAAKENRAPAQVIHVQPAALAVMPDYPLRAAAAPCAASASSLR